MTSALRHMALILVVGTVVLFTNLGGPRLWDRDEPRNAGCTVEMMARGDLVTPVFDDELRTHKPVLLYWFMMSAYAVFGVSEFSARFWSAALGIGTACMTYGLARRLFSAPVGLWSAVILVTTLMFDVACRAATPDSLLIFWCTAALFVYVWGTFPALPHDQCSAGPARLFPSWPVAAVMYGMMGMAVLAKGPVGLVLPTAVIGMYLLIQRLPPRLSRPTNARHVGIRGRVRDICWRILRPFAPGNFLGTCWLMRPLTALAVVTAISLPWYILVGLRTDGEWVKGFLWDHNLGRAAQSLEGHDGSLFFYPLALLAGFFPWSVFAAPTLLESIRRIRSRAAESAGFVFAVCWIGVYMGLFSIAKTKLPSYITPCYPAVAMLVGSFVVAWTRGTALSAPFWPRAALTCLGLVGLVLGIAVPLVANRYLPGEEWLAFIGCIPMLTAIAAFAFVRANSPSRAAFTFAVGALLFTTTFFAVGAARVDRHQTFDSFVSAAFERSHDPRIGTLGVLEPSWVFYTRRPMDHLFAPDLTPHTDHDTPMIGQPRTADWQFKPLLNVWQYLSADPDHYVITTASQLEQIKQVPSQVEIVARAPYFLREDELVLLGTRTSVAQKPPGRQQPSDLR